MSITVFTVSYKLIWSVGLLNYWNPCYSFVGILQLHELNVVFQQTVVMLLTGYREFHRILVSGSYYLARSR